jgi:hypothetical protein
MEPIWGLKQSEQSEQTPKKKPPGKILLLPGGSEANDGKG